MKTVAVSEFKANLMKFLREIQDGTNINITSRGKVVVTVIPPELQRIKARERLKIIAKTAEINDVVSPIDVEWQVNKK